ncbi:MAG: hypothetical protein ACOZQL_10675 [Myxococcota bacterium]
MADALSALGTGTYTVLRRGPSTFLDGRLHAQTPVTLVVPGSLTPLTALELKRMPKGVIVNEAWNLFTTTELKSAQGGVEADRVLIDGEEYSVEKVERWGEAGNFFKSTLVRR